MKIDYDKDKEVVTQINILIGIALGVILGMGISAAIIDDLDSFRIPCTNKVFAKVHTE